MVPMIVRIPFLFVWDFILFVLWIALFGIFGALFIKEKPEGNGGIIRMKNAVVSPRKYQKMLGETLLTCCSVVG